MTSHAIAAVAPTLQILWRQVLRDVPGERSGVVWVVEPRREPDASAELLVAAAYEAANFGRHCVEVAEVSDRDGRPCLARRYDLGWKPLAEVASAGGVGWSVDLPTSLLRRDAARIALLDYLLANPSRHGRSIFLDREGGRLIAGDHGSCLGDRGPTFESCWRSGPIGDLRLTEDEMGQATSWWEGAQRLALPTLGDKAEVVRERMRLPLGSL